MFKLVKKEYNAQNYLEWNNALTNHFFNVKNDQKEVILYADEALINQIGEQNNLGNYNDFLKVVLVDKVGKCAIYDKVAAASGIRRTVDINKTINKSISEFPNILKDLGSRNFKISYFNYIIFYIIIYVSNESASFYDHLNNVVNHYLKEKRRISKLNNLDILFDSLEKWSLQNKLGLFRARRIGSLAYKGLLNYQVVLKPEEHQEFEAVLYTHGIYINDNTIYPELVNKLLPYTNHYRLRGKLKEGVKKPVYAEWFLNRALQFDHKAFSKSESGKTIIIQRKGTLVFNISPTHNLELLTDSLLNQYDEPIGFSVINSGRNIYGFHELPLFVNDTLKFQEQLYITKNESLELKTIPIRGVTFFQKNGDNYIQRLSPDENYDCIVVVQKTEKSWKVWSENSENIGHCRQIESGILPSIFGNDFLFYHVKNVKKSYYGNTEEIYTTSTHNEGFKIKKLGGLKINKNLYLDIGLPYFEVVLEDSQTKVNHKVYRNGAEDKDIEVSNVDNKYYLHINCDTTIDEASLVDVKFQIGKVEKTFDFSITGTSLELTCNDQLFKYDKWGDYTDKSTGFLQGSKLNGLNQISLNNDKKELTDLKEDNQLDQNYLIYLLVGISLNRKEQYLRYKDVLKAITATLLYLKSKGALITEDNYSRYQLINNLVALGYLNYRKNEKDEKEFQLMPFGIRKTEKSFNRISQVYQVTGVYTRFLLDRLKIFCDEHQIEIKYKSVNINTQNSLQSIMLPDIIYLNLKSKVELLRSFIKEEFDQELLIEDTYHTGDSLLKFIGSLSDFEEEHLDKRVNLNNQELFSKHEGQLPRIVETQEDYRRYGSYYSKKFLEKNTGEYYKINHSYWTDLFVQNKRNTPLVYTKRRYDGEKGYNYSKEILIPSKISLPEIVYYAFCNLNHGIPNTIKIFWKNAPMDTSLSKHTFSHFDQYNISDKPNRRENIIRILTGSGDLDNNSQIRYLSNNHSQYKFKYIRCSIFSDFKTAILIEDNSNNIIGLYVYKVLYVNTSLTKISSLESVTLIISDCEPQKLSRVALSDLSENEMLSLVLDGKFDQFDYKKSNKIFKAEVIEEDKIEIRELN
ncbi:hypothetical protein I2486_17775 [Cellulophaga sp. E16_2]|uniref:hypothetical protein n=1 Tax=Cellulophaga sp. E16_2 TaxID=2789297 RepID=UPI001A92E1C3|nr:hypothetical protein [Cellulophaga sp. E16_2]MBO0593255.1 hypothetical protein [Cellulophaga sp. E16_2]